MRVAAAATRAAENEREDPLEQKRVAAKKSTDRDQGSVGAKASSN